MGRDRCQGRRKLRTFYLPQWNERPRKPRTPDICLEVEINDPVFLLDADFIPVGKFG